MQMDKEGKLPRKLHRAAKKDTVTVNDGGYTIMRFHANNPGKVIYGKNELSSLWCLLLVRV